MMVISHRIQNSNRDVSFQLVYGKAFHLPVEVEHKSYWAVKKVNMMFDEAGDHRKLQLEELEEIREMHMRMRGFTEIKRVHGMIKLYRGRILMLVIRYSCINPVYVFFPGKLRSRWLGPYIIKRIYHHGAIEIESLDTQKIMKVNGQRLKIYHENFPTEKLEEFTLANPEYNH